MIAINGISQPAPQSRAAAAHVEDALHQLDEVASTLELIAEAYGKSGDDSPVTMSSLLYQIGLQARELSKIARKFRVKEQVKEPAPAESHRSRAYLFAGQAS